METLAGIFVGLVTFANTVVPQANLPKVLAVETQNTTRPAIEISKGTKEELLKQLKERNLTQRQQLKTRLENVKDTSKRRSVEAINEGLINRHEKSCERWRNSITKLDEIIARIKTRKEKTSSTVSLVDAEKAVSDAKIAVEAQCAKTYSIEVSDERGIGQEVRATVQSLKTDSKFVVDSLKKAQEAIRKVVQVLKSETRPVNTENE